MRRRDFVGHGVLAAAVAGQATAQSLAPAGASTLAVVAELDFTAGREDAAAVALRTLAAATRQEPGCRRYLVTRDLDRANRFHLSELWIDRAALAQHFRTPHMAAFLVEARRLGYATRSVKQIEVAKISDLDTRGLLSGSPS